MRVGPPPLRPPVERHPGAEEEDAARRRLADRLPERVHPEPARDLPLPGPLARPRPEGEAGLVRAPGQRHAHRQREHRGDGGARAPRGERRESERAAQHEPEMKAVHEPVRGEPRHAERLGDQRVQRDHQGHGRRQAQQPPHAPIGDQREPRAPSPPHEAQQGQRQQHRLHGEPSGEGEESHVRPGQRQGHPQVREQRQEPDRGQPEPAREDQRRRAETRAAWPRVQGGQRHQHEGGGRVSGMQQDHRRDDHGARDRRAPGAPGPAQQAERQQRQHAPGEPRRDQTPAQALLHPAPRSRRQRERDEGAGEREPRIAERAAQQRVHGHPRQQPGQPEQDLVDGGQVERAGRRQMDQRAEPREAGRVVLELGVTGPPARIEAPGGEPQRDRVREAIELARVIVEDEQVTAEGAPAEAHGVGGEQRGRQPGAGHEWR